MAGTDMPMRAAMCAAALGWFVAIPACADAAPPAPGGDSENGRLLLRQFGCGACHRIPGVADAKGNVGPSLEKIGRRVYLAGRLPNRPANMVRWIRDPQAIDPRTRMPDLQVSEEHARDMVSYLFTLQ